MSRARFPVTAPPVSRLRPLASWIAVAIGVTLSPVAASAADGSLQRAKTNGLVICGVDGLLPYSSSDAKVPGFEVEIARLLAGDLGVQMKHEWVSWDGLVPALASSRCDAIVNGLFITDERKKTIDFSIPYYGSGETILVRKDEKSVKGLQDLKGKKTGVLAGSVTVADLEKKGIGPLQVYPDQNTIILELNNKRIDAAYLEAPSAAWAIQKDPSLNIKVVEEYVPDERFNAGVGVRKADVELREAVNASLTKLIASGKIADALHHYGVPFFPAK
jgi:polar amino acid transport system substrate-binding protein